MKYNSYVPLHGHSTYSFGDGVAKIEDIVTRCKQIGSPAIALTQHGNLASFLKFYKACNEAQIKPIMGCEFYQNQLYFSNNELFLELKRSKSNSKKQIVQQQNDLNVDDYADINDSSANNHFLTYACNYQGLKNIIKVNNISVNHFYRKPLINQQIILNTLDKNNIVTTGCLQSNFNKLLLQGDTKQFVKTIQTFKDKFNDNFYFELQFNGLKQQDYVNSIYSKLAKKMNIKPVLSLDYHYAWPEDWYIQYLLYTIKNRKVVRQYTQADWFYTVRNLYIKSIEDVYDSAKQYDIQLIDECIKNTFEISQKVNVEIQSYPDNFPRFTSTRKQSNKIFEQIVQKAFIEKQKKGLIPIEKHDEYRKRLDYEIQIIKKKKVADYFLIVRDILQFVKRENGGLGAGRGSAAGSLALYFSDITKVDPIKYKLIFERFLNPARQDPADIDCLIDKTLIKTESGNKTLSCIEVGDKVFDINNRLKTVTNKYAREISSNDIIYKITVKENNYIGFIIANSKHRLITNQRNEVLASQLTQLSSKILSYVNCNSSYCTVIKIQQLRKQQLKDNMLIEIQVQQSSTFQIFPFFENNLDFLD